MYIIAGTVLSCSQADEAMEALASLLKDYFDITPDQQVVLNAQNPSVTVK